MYVAVLRRVASEDRPHSRLGILHMSDDVEAMIKFYDTYPHRLNGDVRIYDVSDKEPLILATFFETGGKVWTSAVDQYMGVSNDSF